jgi:hypothetical protein
MQRKPRLLANHDLGRVHPLSAYLRLMASKDSRRARASEVVGQSMRCCGA